MRPHNPYIAEASKLVPDILALLTSCLLISAILYLGNIIASTPTIVLADYIQMLILVFISGTMFVAIWTQRRNESFHRSETHLNNALGLIEKAKSVLTDDDGYPTNDRICWVTAARLLTRAERIASQISEPVHREIFAAEHDYNRHVFGDFLRDGGNPLPAQFFTGASPLYQSLGAAVYAPDQEKNGGRWIPPRILAIVYRFFQFPEGFEDPLDASLPLTHRETERLWLFGQRGVVDYLTFRNHFFPVGKVVRRVPPPGGQGIDVSAEDIDQQMQGLSGYF